MTLLDVATHLIRRRPTRQRGQWQRFFPPLWVTSTPPIGQCSTARWSFHIPGRPELPPEFPPESLHFISRPVSVPILRSPIPPLRPCAVFFFLADFLIFFFLSFFLIFYFFFGVYGASRKLGNGRLIPVTFSGASRPRPQRDSGAADAFPARRYQLIFINRIRISKHVFYG